MNMCYNYLEVSQKMEANSRTNGAMISPKKCHNVNMYVPCSPIGFIQETKTNSPFVGAQSQSVLSDDEKKTKKNKLHQISLDVMSPKCRNLPSKTLLPPLGAGYLEGFPRLRYAMPSTHPASSNGWGPRAVLKSTPIVEM